MAAARVYIISSVSRTLYTGVTNNLDRRVTEHKERRPGSFTARYNINRLVYFEEFDDISQAIAARTRATDGASNQSHVD